VLDPYHGPQREVDSAEENLRYLRETIELEGPATIAAFFLEPVTGTNGILIPPDGYLQGVRELCDEFGILMVADEVMSGFGRTGEWFAVDHWGVVPDMLTMAKGIANGLPLGAVVTRPEIAASLKALTISTFGGNPVSCAAANATIEIIEDENLPANAEAMGRRLRGGLEELRRRFPRTIGDVRGLGLMQALELVEDETTGNRTPARALTARVFEETKKLGLLIGKGGLEGNCFRIAPALNVGRTEIEEALSLLEEAFATAGAR
jgi:4-aminobutyrate aminotransferase-like enzyme